MNKNITKYVKEILQNDERAREDDWYLIAQVIKKMSYRTQTVSFLYVLEHAQTFNLPSFEAITRARRKELAKELDPIQDIRENEEKEYREYYGG